MPEPIELADLALSEHAAVFLGKDHGAAVSFFVTTHPRGHGPALHTHPYEETFLVQGGPLFSPSAPKQSTNSRKRKQRSTNVWARERSKTISIDWPGARKPSVTRTSTVFIHGRTLPRG